MDGRTLFPNEAKPNILLSHKILLSDPTPSPKIVFSILGACAL
jgi:hypothetical protein